MQVSIKINTAHTVFLTLHLLFLVPWSALVFAQDTLPEVLVLHSFRTTNPANTDWYLGIMEGLTSGADRPIQIDVEAPDLSRFDDTVFMNDILDIYRRRYRDKKPDLIIPTYTPALRFLLEYGEELFPGIPIVFCAADSGFIATQVLPPHVTGVSSTPDIRGTVELALQIQPDTERIVVVVGAGITDKRLDFYAQQALEPLEGKVEIQWLRALPADELEGTVSNLPDRTAILFLIQNEDRNGIPQVPINVLRLMSNAGGAPVYGLWDTLIGDGFLGGRLLQLYDEGVAAGKIGLKILNGSLPEQIPITHPKQNPAIFDGQELERWKIDESLLPPDSLILNREPSVWDKYRVEITATGALVGVQALLIFALVINRTRLRRTRSELQKESDRRRQAEITGLQFRDELEKFNKERFLSAMATTIAHEISQPLIAIQNYAQAAKRRSDANSLDVDKLAELLAKIEGQAGRAGDIIGNVRSLVQADEADTHPTNVDTIVDKVLEIVASELEIRECRIAYSAEDRLPQVMADELQIQLVLVNILRNAMRSMVDKRDQADKLISMHVKSFTNDALCVSVEDQGPGISAERLEQVFEPMYSESGEGMGMGLAICRMIIEAHGGRIWCEDNSPGGAKFLFTLRVAPA